MQYHTGVFWINSDRRLADITDGTSSTILIGEHPYSPKSWMQHGTSKDFHSVYRSYTNHAYNHSGAPINGGLVDVSGDFKLRDFGSYHTGGAQFLLVDGSVQFLSENIDYETYCNLGDRLDGQTIGEF